MGRYLTLEETISLILSESTARGMADSRTVVAYALDYMDPDSKALRVLSSNLVVNRLRPDSDKYRRLERAVHDGFLEPFTRAVRGELSLPEAEMTVRAYFRDKCMVQESISNEVASGIFGGVARWRERIEKNMAAETLEVGDCLFTVTGKVVRVIEKIGEGSRGGVYKVEYDGGEGALKWYRPSAICNRDRMVARVRSKVSREAPGKEFLWPRDLVEGSGGPFGYVMDLCPPGFVTIDHFLIHPDLVATHRCIIDACLHVVMTFRHLHDKGYCLRMLDGILINLQTGKVLVADDDNVVHMCHNEDIMYTPRFTSPEIVSNPFGAEPTALTDRHIMAEAVFALLFCQHPLEGMRFSSATSFDSRTLERFYGSDSVFVMDPDDSSNRPDAVHSYVSDAWARFPTHMRDLFCRSFSYEALHNPTKRPNELKWTWELAWLRAETFRCHCGNEVFLDGGGLKRCDNCGALCGSPLRIEVLGRWLAVLDDACVYRCMVEPFCNADEALEPQLRVQGSSLVNVSRTPWKAYADGQQLQVGPGQAIRASDGLGLEILGERVRVCRNPDAS